MKRIDLNKIFVQFIQISLFEKYSISFQWFIYFSKKYSNRILLRFICFWCHFLLLEILKNDVLLKKWNCWMIFSLNKFSFSDWFWWRILLKFFYLIKWKILNKIFLIFINFWCLSFVFFYWKFSFWLTRNNWIEIL